MITVLTPVHGVFDIARRTFDSIEAVVPEPFLHLVGEDFSPPKDAAQYVASSGPVGEQSIREVYHCSTLGATAAPNMGLSLAYAWQRARDMMAEALLVVESDVILRPGLIEAFRAAIDQRSEVAEVGCVAPLFTEVGGNAVSTYGGMSVEFIRDDAFLGGIKLCAEIGSWDNPQVARLAPLWWAHLACLWIPRSTLLRDDLMPDPSYGFFYCDHNLTERIKRAGLEVLVTTNAVAEHSRLGHSTCTLWPSQPERDAAEGAAYRKLQEDLSV